MAFYLAVTYIVFSTIFTLALNNIAVTQKTHPCFTFLFREWRLPSQGDLFLFMIIGLISAGCVHAGAGPIEVPSLARFES